MVFGYMVWFLLFNPMPSHKSCRGAHSNGLVAVAVASTGAAWWAVVWRTSVQDPTGPKPVAVHPLWTCKEQSAGQVLPQETGKPRPMNWHF